MSGRSFTANWGLPERKIDSFFSFYFFSFFFLISQPLSVSPPFLSPLFPIMRLFVFLSLFLISQCAATMVAVEFHETPTFDELQNYAEEHGLVYHELQNYKHDTGLYLFTVPDKKRRSELVPEHLSVSPKVRKATVQKPLMRTKRIASEDDDNLPVMIRLKDLTEAAKNIDLGDECIRKTNNGYFEIDPHCNAALVRKLLDVRSEDLFHFFHRRFKRDHNDYLFTPTDPDYPKQWHLHPDEGKDHVHLNVEPVWMTGNSGFGVTICVVDDGLDYMHPDIAPNYLASGSYDFNHGVAEPGPYLRDDYHGTRCAGEIAAVGWNEKCGIGVAPAAGISAVQILSGNSYDSIEGMALSYRRDLNYIYSNSWGPDDDGMTVEAPGQMARKAFEEGVRLGRNGLGSIFVFASGNGGSEGDDCNYDGYANSPFTITIGAISKHEKIPYYQEHCAAMLAVAPSSDLKSRITTTDVNGKCTDQHTGTSAAAPLAAGVIALMLSTNPLLRWHDVQDIIARNAVKFYSEEIGTSWITTAAGLYYHPFLGFGKMDAQILIEAAENHKLLPDPVVQTFTPPMEGSLNILTYTPLKLAFDRYVYSDPEMTLFHVQVHVSLLHTRRGELSFYLTSGSGTRVCLARSRPKDASSEGLLDWTFSTVAFWGEYSGSVWTLEIVDETDYGTNGLLLKWGLTFYGIPVVV
jgi:subtilisin family serine protease